MATQSLSPEMTSYARLCLAINDVCTKCLRDVLLRNIPCQDIKQAMKAHWGPHYNSPMLKKYPFSNIFQNHQLNPNFSVSDCDMSLLYTLIRNVSSVQQPLLGWGQSCWNNPQDTSIGANVERLHELRNTVIHLQEPGLSNQDFISYWNKVRDCVSVIDTYLGGTTYQQTLDCLKTADMDPDYANRLIESFRTNLQDLQARQHEQGRTLSDVREVLNQAFHELTVKSEENRTHLEAGRIIWAEVKYLLKDEFAKDVNDIKDSMKEMLERMEGTAKENDQIHPQLNSDQNVRTEKSTSNQVEHESEISLEKHDARDSENSTDCNKNRVEKTDVDESRRSESRAVQIQLKTNDVLVKANQDTDGGIEIGDLASGQDGKLRITKQYALIKSNLTRESGLEIAKCLLDQKLLSQDAYDRMGNTPCARRHLIDMLLKKVIHGGKEEIIEAFFKRLIVECQLVARAVKETTITNNDRLRVAQLEARGIEPRCPLGIKRSGKSQRDVNFFKYHLCASEEVVEHITDVMLSRLHFSILDHCRIVDCPRSEDMISVLFQTMQLYKVNVVSELNGVVEPSLYQKWMESRNTKGSWMLRLYRWIKKSKPVIDDSFKSEDIELQKVERGSIILKFIAGVNFSVDLLKPESLKKKIKTLLERGCLGSKTEPKCVAHITVYIESPPNEGLEEIHFYIDFPATDVSIEAEDHQAEMRIRNRDIMLEEMNPARLKQWMLDQPSIQKSHRDMLECKLSEQGLLRKEEMTVLFDFINGLENGDHLLEKYCETNDLYVYNKVYRKHQESHSQPEEISGHRAAVTYVKGGGLQELFSFSIIFNDEEFLRMRKGVRKASFSDTIQGFEDIHRRIEDMDLDKEKGLLLKQKAKRISPLSELSRKKQGMLLKHRGTRKSPFSDKVQHLEESFQTKQDIEPDTEEASTFVMPSPPTSDTEMFIRIAYLLDEVGTMVLRHLLCHLTDTANCTLNQYLGKHMNNINSLRKVFTPSHMDTMFPPNGDVTNLDEYDITLLSTIFLNIVPTLNYQEKDMITRLQEERNKVYGHVMSCQISAIDFQTYWTDISSLLTAISQLCGDTTFVAKIFREIQRCKGSAIHDDTYLDKFKTRIKMMELSEDDLQNVATRLQAVESNTKLSATKDRLLEENTVEKVQPGYSPELIYRFPIREYFQEERDVASGRHAKLCITKQYAFIKSSLTRESGLAIAKCLLDQTLLSQDTYDRMGNTCCARRHPIDFLLKKAIHGGKEVIVAFLKMLKVECPLIARAVKETTITDKDRLRFSELEARRRVKRGQIMRFGISERDVSFFKYHLCESEEVVEHIADVMLSSFHFSVLDHSSIIDCPTSRERISVLFKTMHLYKLDVVTEFHGVVKPKLYQKWMESRSTQGSRWYRLYRWIKKSKPAIDDSFKSEEIQLKKVERDSIILRFITGVNFSVDLLKPESFEMKIKTLLKRGFLESKTEPKRVAHITVYIDSPANKGQEEIHIYIDFHGTDVSIEEEDHQAEMKIRNRDIMSEEMNPARLKQWMLDQPCIEKTQRDLLESKLSEEGLFRQEEMRVLLEFINGLENGDLLLEKYCEKNDLYVYNKVFRKHQESQSQQEEIPGHRVAVTFVKGGGLQELFAFSIIFNDEDIETDTEEDIYTDAKEDIKTDTEDGLSKDQLTSCDEVLSSENN